MTETDHIPFQNNLAAYALGALDADEIMALETHLRQCDACRQELAKFQGLSADLAAALPPRAPSAALRRKLAARLPSAQKSTRQFWQIHWSFGQAAVVSALVLMLVLNVYAVLQVRGLQAQQTLLTQRVASEQSALMLLTYPETQTISIHNGDITGSLLIDRDQNRAALVLWNMPVLAPGQTYQIWLIDSNEKRVSAGIFNADTSQLYTTVILTTPASLEGFKGVGVTIEPNGGSPQPTGPRVFRTDF